MSFSSFNRRHFVLGSVGAAALTALPSLRAQQASPRVLRIGHQKGFLSLLKGRGTLEQRLAPLGVRLSWTEFTAGPVQLEALNVGSIDFGDVGEAPPIFAQAAGAPLAYVAATEPALRDKRAALKDFKKRVARAQVWSYRHSAAFGESLAKIIGIPVEAARLQFERRALSWQDIDEQVIADQQRTADFYVKAGLIKQRLEVRNTFDLGFNGKA